MSLRRAQRAQKMRELIPGQELEGTVSGLATFGAFVDIGVGRDGLVHISQLREERVSKVEDVLTVGDKVKVRVMEVDPQNKRISLTMRPEQPETPAAAEGDEAEPTTMPTQEARPDTRFAAPSYAPRSDDVGRREGPREGGRAPFREGPREGSREGARDTQGRRRSGGGGGGGKRPPRTSDTSSPATPETYTTSSDNTDEDFVGNATLEDLVSKFGGGNRKDRRRRFEEEEEDDDDRRVQRQRQREAIRRTLRHTDEE